MKHVVLIAAVLLASPALAKVKDACKDRCAGYREPCRKSCNAAPKKQREACVKNSCPALVAQCEDTCRGNHDHKAR